MRALTLTQPWAGLVASGIKLIENRPRRMIKSDAFGKRFAIHASREFDDGVYSMLALEARDLFAVDEYSDEELAANADWRPWQKLAHVTGAVIAVATLRDAMHIGGNSDETTQKMLAKLGLEEQARWTFGPTCYVLADVIALPTPVSARGYQGFWTLSEDVDRAVTAQLATGTA
jgi:hypothetical protein